MKRYIEITLKFLVLKNSSKENTLKNAINIIDKYVCMYSKTYHKKSTLKDYCASRIEPAINTNYRRGDIVYIKVRTDLDDLSKQFSLAHLENDYLRTIFIDQQNIFNRNYISEIYTLTPAVFTIDSTNKYVLSDRNNVQGLKDAILKNAKAKSQLLQEHDFIEEIYIKNKYPISIKLPREVNEVIYLGDKLQIKVKKDKLSQKIAHDLIVKGLGKHCTSGNGFINFKK